MIAMIMKNKPQFTQMSFALETGLGLVRSIIIMDGILLSIVSRNAVFFQRL